MIELPPSPSFHLHGMRALVTGAGRGIGLACAAALADAGAHVTLAARSETEVEAVASAIRAKGGLAESLVLDVSDLEAVAIAIARCPAFTILVNNAGTNRPKPFGSVTEADYDAVLDLNLKSAFFVAQAVVSRIIDAKAGGSIIMMSSQMGHVGAPGRTLYCASKWGIEGLTRATALDLAPHAIRVNTICPTFIETSLTRPMLADAAFKESVLTKIKLGRIGQVQDVTGAVVFLASNASALITGSSILVDGGWTAD